MTMPLPMLHQMRKSRLRLRLRRLQQTPIEPHLRRNQHMPYLKQILIVFRRHRFEMPDRRRHWTRRERRVIVSVRIGTVSACLEGICVHLSVDVCALEFRYDKGKLYRAQSTRSSVR
jgi:hypothetical protein